MHKHNKNEIKHKDDILKSKHIFTSSNRKLDKESITSEHSVIPIYKNKPFGNRSKDKLNDVNNKTNSKHKKVKKNKFKVKEKESELNIGKYLNLSIRNKVQLYGCVPIALIALSIYMLYLWKIDFGTITTNITTKTMNELNTESLNQELDTLNSKLNELKDSNSADSNKTNNNSSSSTQDTTLSKIKITKPIITKELTAITAKYNLQYAELIFASNMKSNALPDIQDPHIENNSTTPNPHENTNESKPESSSDSSGTNSSASPSAGTTENSTNKESSSNTNSLLDTYAFNDSIINDKLSSSAAPVANNTNNQTSQSPQTVSNTQQSINPSQAGDVLTDSTKTDENITKFKESLSNKLNTVLKNNNKAGYISECVLVIAKGNSIDAFNFIQSLYLNKDIKFNIIYATITRDKDYITNKPNMYTYTTNTLNKDAYVGILIDISSTDDAPLNWYDSLNNPVDISDIFN